MSVSDAAETRAEAAFKRKEDQARDGANAWAEYEAKSRAITKNMERLRALRLAKEAAKPEATKDSGRTVYPGVRLNGEASRPPSTPRQTASTQTATMGRAVQRTGRAKR